jgi:preprotein translocase subunit YajC
MNSIAILATNLNLAGWLASTEAPAGGANPNVPFFLQPPIIMMALMVAMFYFLIIRPQSKKAKEHQKLIDTLKSGDKVVVAGGIHGIVSNIKEGIAVIRIAEGVKIEVDKSSIATVTKTSETESK